jgi:hypothetical protein
MMRAQGFPRFRIGIWLLILSLAAAPIAPLVAATLLSDIGGRRTAIVFDDRLHSTSSMRSVLHCDTGLREHPECVIRQFHACIIDYDLEPCEPIGIGRWDGQDIVFGIWPAEEWYPPYPELLEFRMKSIHELFPDTVVVEVEEHECWRWKDRWAWVVDWHRVHYILSWEAGRGWRLIAWSPWTTHADLPWLVYLDGRPDRSVSDGTCFDP